MDSPVTNDLSSSSNTSGTMTNRRSITIKSRRNSSRISTRSSSNPRNPSSLRGRISKTPTLPRKHVKTTKKNDTTNGFNHQKHSDSNVQIDNNQPMENENVSSDSANVGSSRENACDVSVASDDTVIDHVTIKKRKENKVMNHFTYNTTNEKYKCSICKKEYKADQYSDSNLRSHLGFKHNMHELLFPSQQQRAPGLRRKSKVPAVLKKKLDLAAIQCILDDGHAFGVFRRPGMQQFLNVLLPGYYGPSRKTVKNHLFKLYKQHRSNLRDLFEKIDYLSLTLDLWKNSRRIYFLVITAHYQDEAMQYKSIIISFRRFAGRHLSKRLEAFITNEIRKLNIEAKVVSVTTDNGSDIKAATSNYRFGTRFSCAAHDINLTISTGLALWKLPKSISSKTSTPIPATTNSMSNRDIEDEEVSDASRLIDDNEVSDDDYDDSSEHPDVEDSDSLSLNEGNSSCSSSNSSSSDSEDEDQTTVTQRDRQIDNVQQHELQQIIVNKEELQKNILNVLKRVRRLVSLIHKSQGLTSYVRYEASRQQISMDEDLNSDNFDDASNFEPPKKINDLVADFHVRWSSTYLMLSRLIKARKIVNEITHSPPNRNRLTMKKLKKLRSLSLSHFDWELLQALANVLAPFHLATICLSGRQYPTLSLSYWIEQNLRVYLSTDEPDMLLENSLRHLLLEKFKVHFDSKVTMDQKNTKLIAAYLDPFTLNEMSTDEMQLAESLLMDELTMMKKTPNNIQPKQNSSTSSSSSVLKNGTKSINSLLSTIQKFKISCNQSLSTFRNSAQAAQTPNTLTLKEELSLYLSKCKASNDFDTFWKENQTSMPLLASFVRRYGIIPATSVASESAFSVAGYVNRKQRSSLSPSTLRYLMVLKKSF